MKILSEGNIFRKFEGLMVTKSSNLIELYFDDESHLFVTSDHKLLVNGLYVMAKDAKLGDIFTTTIGTKELIYKCKNNKETLVYDPVEVENVHNFFGNNTLQSQCIFLDELAFVRNDVDFFASTYPVITSGTSTKVIIASTPMGMNLFYKMWNDAENGRNDFIPKRYYWHDLPGRDEKWKEETIRNIGAQRFLQEFDCQFLGSANTLISSAKLQQLTHKEPIIDENSYKVYCEVIHDHEYVACVDVAEGIGRDYSVICIFDVSEKPFTQVAIYRNNLMPPIIFAEVVYKICRQYNEAYCIVESNGVGRIVADTLYNDFEYENMLTSKEIGGFNELSMSGNVIGLRQTRKTKATGASALKSLIESDTLILYDFDSIAELTTFIKTRSSYQAESGKYDDICMTLLMFAWFTHQPYFEETTNESMREIIRGNYSKMEDNNHLIFGFYDDGIEEENPLALSNNIAPVSAREAYFELPSPKRSKLVPVNVENNW